MLEIEYLRSEGSWALERGVHWQRSYDKITTRERVDPLLAVLRVAFSGLFPCSKARARAPASQVDRRG